VQRQETRRHCHASAVSGEACTCGGSAYTLCLGGARQRAGNEAGGRREGRETKGLPFRLALGAREGADDETGRH
jgi:hypothetical protein